MPLAVESCLLGHLIRLKTRSTSKDFLLVAQKKLALEKFSATIRAF